MPTHWESHNAGADSIRLLPGSIRRIRLAMPHLRLQHSETASFLSRPESYRDGTLGVQVTQTETSWVFLTDRFAYKLKKPLRWGTFDYSTLELREKATREELRLGSRLSPRVYLSMIPILRNEHGGLSLREPGQVIDWLLEMRRLDEQLSLARCLEGGELASSTLRRLAVQLSELYAQQPPIAMKADDFLAALRKRVERYDQILQHHQVERTLARQTCYAQMAYLQQCDGQLAQRVCDGRIVVGHGDLRPEHIFLETPPSVIGCNAFPEETWWNDVAEELADLAMQCDLRGRPSVGEAVKNGYAQQSGDRIDADLFLFYKCNRAHRRAAMLAHRSAVDKTESRQAQRSEITACLQAANAYSRSLGLVHSPATPSR